MGKGPRQPNIVEPVGPRSLLGKRPALPLKGGGVRRPGGVGAGCPAGGGRVPGRGGRGGRSTLQRGRVQRVESSSRSQRRVSRPTGGGVGSEVISGSPSDHGRAFSRSSTSTLLQRGGDQQAERLPRPQPPVSRSRRGGVGSNPTSGSYSGHGRASSGSSTPSGGKGRGSIS